MPADMINPKFVYSEADTELVLTLPATTTNKTLGAVGGDIEADSGMRAAYVVRRDESLSFSLRFYEEEWPDVQSFIDYAMAGSPIDYYSDSTKGTKFNVVMDSPAIGTTYYPQPDPDYPRVFFIPIVLTAWSPMGSRPDKPSSFDYLQPPAVGDIDDSGLVALMPDTTRFGTNDGGEHFLGEVPVTEDLPMTAVMCGILARPYDMAASIGFKHNADDTKRHMLTVDNGALNSRVYIHGDGPGHSIAITTEENRGVPVKIQLTPGFIRGYVTDDLLRVFSMQYVPNAQYTDWRPCASIQNTAGGIPNPPGGNHYDCHFLKMAICKSNAIKLRNIPIQTSVRVTIGKRPAVITNVDTTGRISLDAGEEIFPVKVRFEFYSEIDGGGERYAIQEARMYGGDIWKGPEVDIAPRVPGPALSRAGWTATAGRTSVFFGGPHETLNNSIGTSWVSGGKPNLDDFNHPFVDFFRVDMQAPLNIGTIRALCSGGDTHPASGDIYTSLDGSAFTFRKSWTAGDVADGLLTVVFDSIVSARYFKIMPTSLCIDPTDWYVIDELYAYADIP